MSPMTRLLRLFHRALHPDRGQIIVMFAAIFTITMVMGVITVDFGLWLSERRGSQTDADLPALAGAREYMLWLAQGNRCEDGGGPDQAVEAAVEDWFNLNTDQTKTDPDPRYTYTVEPDCPCVDVRVKHESKTLFSSFFSPIFDGVAGNIGAHARACAGAAISAGDVTPAYIISGGDCFKASHPDEPDYDHYCWVVGGAWPDHPQRHDLNLDPTGQVCSPGGDKKDVEEMFRNQGMGGNCSININDPPTCGSSPWLDCVDVWTGNFFHNVDAVYDRITPPPCDTNGNGIDDLSEVIDPTTHDRVVCSPNAPQGQRYSPRLITTPIIDSPGDAGGTCPNKKGPCPILGLANFYIAGCVDDRDLAALVGGSQQLTTDERKCRASIPNGHEAVLGKWVSITTTGSGVGPVDPSTTQFGIALCDWESGEGCGGGSGGTPVPTVAPTATPAPTDTPAPTATRTPAPTPCPTVCNPGGQQCHPDCPVPTNTPRPTNTPVPTATRTPVPTATRTPVPTATRTPAPPTATPTICIKPNGKPC